MKKSITASEKYSQAMEITDQTKADEYFEMCIQNNMSTSGHTREEAEVVERSNLGYWAGYYDNETRTRVERLFKCAHPFFEAIAEKGPPTMEEAFEMGRKLAEKRMGRKS